MHTSLLFLTHFVIFRRRKKRELNDKADATYVDLKMVHVYTRTCMYIAWNADSTERSY